MKAACIRLALAAIAIQLGISQFAPCAQAQDGERRPRSLSDRLEQFRRDLLGSPDSEEVDSTPSTRTAASRSATGMENRPKTTAGPNAGRTAPQSRIANRSTAPASRMVTRENTPAAASPRMASKPAAPRTTAPATAPLAVEAEPEPATEMIEEPAPTVLQGTAGRPARRGAMLEPVTPRIARSNRDEAVEEEVFEEEPEIESQPVVVPAGSRPRSANANVLFSSKSPVLALEATGPRTVLIGREAAFSVQLRNAGDVMASGVVVKIHIPAFAEVAAAEPSFGKAIAPKLSEQDGTLEWHIDQLDVRGRETLSLKLIPRKSMPLDLSMHWQCTPELSQTIVEVQEPKLNLTISGPREVFYGQTKIYKLTLTNPGNGDADNVLINLMPIDKSESQAATYRVGVLKAGDSKAVDIELTARQAGNLQIRAQAVGDGGLRVDAAEDVTVRRANLKVAVAGAKVKYAGTPTMFRIRVANQGDAIAESVELTAMLPPDAEFLNASNNGRHDVNGSKVIWRIGAMQPGDDHVFDVVCTPNSPGENILQAVAQSADDLTAQATASTMVEALADLKLEVRDPRGPVAVGEDAQYELILRNRGTKAAELIDVVAFFSEGLEAVTVKGAEHQIGPGQVVLKTLPAIPAGAETTVYITCRADRPGNLILRTEVSCKNPGTKLSAEETTHFYGGEELELPEEELAVEEEPTETTSEEVEDEPAGLAPSAASRYPTRR